VSAMSRPPFPKNMSTQTPLVSAVGIWYSYFTAAEYPGDNASHTLELSSPEAFGNETLFSETDFGVALTHRSVVNVDVHARCEHDVAIERTLGVRIDKAGTILERGQSIFVAGEGNSAYQGILEEGQQIGAFVSAPGDAVKIQEGYISVAAQPI
jgi:hypothetical protein